MLVLSWHGSSYFQDTETVAAYSGNNIQNILERAKRFETEVLEKLRRQTNAVLFDQQGFDDSLEFDLSRRPVVETAGTGRVTSLSSGSITSTPDDSLSTGKILKCNVLTLGQKKNICVFQVSALKKIRYGRLA